MNVEEWQINNQIKLAVGTDRKEVKFSTATPLKEIREFCYTEFKIDKTKFNIRLILGGKMLDFSKKIGAYTAKDCVLHGFKVPK